MCANTQEKITLGGESSNYHFAMNGKSYQVLVKHFYSLLPKVSAEETKHLLAPLIYVNNSIVPAGERCLSVNIWSAVTSDNSAASQHSSGLAWAACCQHLRDLGWPGWLRCVSSCMVEWLCGHLLHFNLIKNSSPIPTYHCQSWQCLLLSSGRRSTK